jgi:hypothetical protein
MEFPGLGDTFYTPFHKFHCHISIEPVNFYVTTWLAFCCTFNLHLQYKYTNANVHVQTGNIREA